MGAAVLGMFAVFLTQMAGSYLAAVFFSGTDLWSLIFYQIFLFIISLITAVFSAGLSYMYLNMAREQEYSLADLLYFFRSQLTVRRGQESGGDQKARGKERQRKDDERSPSGGFQFFLTFLTEVHR